MKKEGKRSTEREKKEKSWDGKRESKHVHIRTAVAIMRYQSILNQCFLKVLLNSKP